MSGMIVLALVILVTTSVAVAQEVYLLPQQSNTAYSSTANVEIWVDATDFQGGQINLTYDPTCADVTDWTRNTTNFPMGGREHYAGNDWITFTALDSLPDGKYRVGTLTVQCVNARGESCETSLQFVTPSKLFDHTGKSVAAMWTEGTFGCNRTLDTGAGTYPSISGTHNGTITPNRTIEVQKLYTYPCAGTGGHTEYARIWDLTLDVNATWEGYEGDWHNISFLESFTLAPNETYNYTIVTGSYPQIIHEQKKEVTGGAINCTIFTDANGKKYNDWIPAIRLW
ncbi:MAG: hypothetical protein WAV32_00285 [Halobacteriota archaeon]